MSLNNVANVGVETAEKTINLPNEALFFHCMNADIKIVSQQIGLYII